MNSIYCLNYIMRTVYTNGTQNLYIGLSSSAPNSDGTGITEPEGGDYERAPVGALSEPLGGMVTNLTDIVFPESADIWFDSENPALYYVIFDGKGKNANFLSSGSLTPSRVVGDGVTIKIIATSIEITLLDLPESVDE